MNDTNQKQLGNTLWSIADQLREAMDVLRHSYGPVQ
jgi:type I restriction-modification system DNA methylase subunit